MTFLSCRRRVLPVVLLLAALVAVVPPSVALAQAPAGQTVQARPATRTETRDDDDSGKWGLLGFLGLVGLAGLLRRDRARPLDRTDPTRSSIGGRSLPPFPTSSLTYGVSVTQGRFHFARASRKEGISIHKIHKAIVTRRPNITRLSARPDEAR